MSRGGENKRQSVTRRTREPLCSRGPSVLTGICERKICCWNLISRDRQDIAIRRLRCCSCCSLPFQVSLLVFFRQSIYGYRYNHESHANCRHTPLPHGASQGMDIRSLSQLSSSQHAFLGRRDASTFDDDSHFHRSSWRRIHRVVSFEIQRS